MISTQVCQLDNNDSLLTLDGVCRVSILSCLLLACSFVGSLYWDTAVPVHTAVCQYVIKRRFTTVLVVSALSPPVLKYRRLIEGYISIHIVFSSPLNWAPPCGM
uniref:Uncharacterized protein n=1 Tax=Oncorhynchus mykiss TaxID=8022 RepID=A0A8C7WGM6_ONCMY